MGFLEFFSENDFLEWKQKIKKDDQSSFVLVKCYEFNSGEKMAHYKYHLSGLSNPVRDKDRHCPTLKIFTQTVNNVNEIKVNYQLMHVGHDLQVGN